LLFAVRFAYEFGDAEVYNFYKFFAAMIAVDDDVVGFNIAMNYAY